ncbi:heavy metal-binding domain-containing protein [Echinimonas agarilytica]|uniref:UPF0145 protein NAF29_09345 n=1 Tax=Echinimonas agarilytica TaxID=1215918 RepID=A0AA42B7Z1_9GAMM|nr:heavy metal-binding domain-containing protein [Echinimonas agarilytica]MCM2679868.1 heavy metal-binding domain-containing protein [Echinimonas agarilytica]
MIIATTEHIGGYTIVENLGVVTGNIVQSKHVGRDIMAGLKTIFGGEIRGYTEMLSEARDNAQARMLEQAQTLGADAVVGVRFTSSAIMDGASELMVFGTAVKIRRS